MSTRPLALVIPAYKGAYFRETLRSIAAQTCRDVPVYVGDDASPDGLEAICREFGDQLDIRYHRFAHNLGRRDLVGQWMRTISLSTEPWVCMFGDDDVMTPDSLESIVTTLEADPVTPRLYRLAVTEIDASGSVERETPSYPQAWASLEYALARFESRVSSFAPEYVFSRQAFLEAGGFTRFALGWCADDAMWIQLGRPHGIHTLQRGRLKWRNSGQNLSAHHGAHSRTKLGAAVAFVGWFSRYLERAPPRGSEPTREDLILAARWWLRWHSRSVHAHFWPHAAGQLATAAFGQPGLGAVRMLVQTALWDLEDRFRR